jgi:hypothetical protein
MAGAHADVRDILRAEGLEERLGHIGRGVTAIDILDEFEGTAVVAASRGGETRP